MHQWKRAAPFGSSCYSLNSPVGCALICFSMNNDLKTYIEHYISLETGMQELVQIKCSSLCGQCTAICCDVVMCVEAVKSPFLMLIHQQTEQFDKQLGFLSPTGCRLKKGRPSICYEYYCDNHFFNQPSDLHAEVLQILGSLLYHATRNAQGDLPLDELSESALNTLNVEKLELQLAESFQALEIIKAFMRSGTLTDDDQKILKQIRIPEEFDVPPESSAR